MIYLLAYLKEANTYPEISPKEKYYLQKHLAGSNPNIRSESLKENSYYTRS